MFIFSSILNCSYANQKNSIISRWKYRSKGPLKAIFCHQKSNKKANKFGMKFSSTSNIVHELAPKKMGICLAGKQNIIKILVTQGYLLSGKVWWAVQIGSFWQKIEVFYRPKWTKIMELSMNFKYLQIQKWMLHAGRAEKVDKKNSFPELWSLNCWQKCIF